jgi:hypothetical protein
MAAAEARYGHEPADTRSPEQLFEHQWAMELLRRVLKRVREEYVESGRALLFEALEPCLIGRRESLPYAALAAQLGRTEAAIKMAVQRLRGRYRECLKEEISHTVAPAVELEEELRHLFRVLARN